MSISLCRSLVKWHQEAPICRDCTCVVPAAITHDRSLLLAVQYTLAVQYDPKNRRSHGALKATQTIWSRGILRSPNFVAQNRRLGFCGCELGRF